MPRKTFVCPSDLPIHLNARTTNKEWFELPLNQMWKIMEDYLFFIHHAYRIEIISFVLMSNHWHLIARSPRQNLGEAMNYFMRESSKAVNRELNKIDQTYGSRFHRTIITSNHHLQTVYKYVYQNPIRARIAPRVEAYPFSTLHGLLGFSRLMIPLIQDQILFPNVSETINWLNQPVELNDESAVRIALKKRIFKLPRHGVTKRSHQLNFKRY